MGVFSEVWWGVWWFWMLLWLVTAICVVTVAVLAVSRTARGRQAPDRSLTYRICFYLNDPQVIDYYMKRGDVGSLRKNVKQTTAGSKNVSVRASGFGASAGGGKNDNSEIVSEYLEVTEPISVIGGIMDELEEKNFIVHVDLVTETIRRNAALTQSLAALERSGTARQSVRLRDIEDFVLIRGRFRKISESTDATVFLAPYGDPDDPAAPGPRVRVSCSTEWLRNEVPRGTFSARCLGKVQDWNAEDAVLEVDAMAIFR
ncbi:hypothetical protein [Streptomyces sp. NPDC005408]|uniref:hypothetical protein n=1 Tax=Streptomyces sp. NPDC005408 TaxID=3155341 RepID=UPI0033A18C5F